MGAADDARTPEREPSLSTLPTRSLVTIIIPAGETYQWICDLVGWIDPTEPALPKREWP